MRILVAGASGFIGSRLCPALKEDGHEVRALTRRPEQWTGAGTAVGGDVDRPATLRPALEGCEVAYYLVHALDHADFAQRDAAAARAFGRAAAEAGVQRIVYLGGLGDEREGLSAHLRSRREVEHLLGEAGVPVTVLRAGVVVGHGSIGTGNVAMTLAAGAMGTLFSLQRKASGGIQAPTITHLTWSALVLRFLPPVVHGRR